jgi:hypothetical protein
MVGSTGNTEAAEARAFKV